MEYLRSKVVHGQTASKAPESVDEVKLQDAITNAASTLRSLPIGWNCKADLGSATSAGTWEEVIVGYWRCAKIELSGVTLIQFLGWMVTAAALTVGAPFWFDLLQKFVNFRGAGEKPKREDEKVPA